MRTWMQCINPCFESHLHGKDTWTKSTLQNLALEGLTATLKDIRRGGCTHWLVVYEVHLSGKCPRKHLRPHGTQRHTCAWKHLVAGGGRCVGLSPTHHTCMGTACVGTTEPLGEFLGKR